MYELMIVIFVLGYLAIALEHPIKIDKAASAVLIGVLCWTVYMLGGSEILSGNTDFQHFLAKNPDQNYIDYIGHHQILHHLGEISEILFFLLGAMTIVELIDAHEGFNVITSKIQTTKKIKLLWILSILTFFFSAALDNLTTSIVMAALLKKLIKDKQDLWFFAGMIVLAANAGGAWSPIGDVTTIMLWIGGQVTAGNIILEVFMPSLICMVVPLLYLTVRMKGHVERPKLHEDLEHRREPTTKFEQNFIFILGVASLLFVPIFKTVTHLPPFMGILLGLGVLWVVTELMHRNKNYEEKSELSVIGVLRKVDVASVLFFLGILSAVAALQSAGHLNQLASYLDRTLGNIYLINTLIGLLSSIVDNVPLVAGAMGMYQYPTDHHFWEFLAYCAGTGGSCLIIGSAAGVAVMGIIKIDFIWYLKRISLLALLGYLSGAAYYFLVNVYL